MRQSEREPGRHGKRRNRAKGRKPPEAVQTISVLLSALAEHAILFGPMSPWCSSRLVSVQVQLVRPDAYSSKVVGRVDKQLPLPYS